MVTTGGSGSLGVEESRALLQKTVERDEGGPRPGRRRRRPPGLSRLDEWCLIMGGYIALLVLLTAPTPWRWWGLGVGVVGISGGAALGQGRARRWRAEPEQARKRPVRDWRQSVVRNVVVVVAVVAVALATGKPWIIGPGSVGLLTNIWSAYQARDDDDFSAHRQNGWPAGSTNTTKQHPGSSTGPPI